MRVKCICHHAGYMNCSLTHPVIVKWSKFLRFIEMLIKHADYQWYSVVCCSIQCNCAEGLHFSAFHYILKVILLY